MTARTVSLATSMFCVVAGVVLPRLAVVSIANAITQTMTELPFRHFDPPDESTQIVDEATELTDDDDSARRDGPDVTHRRSISKSSRASPTATSDTAASGILVRQNAVRVAVRAGVRPTATPVPETLEHPAGLVVYGWGASGTGLADGDIIVSVSGRKPNSVDEIIAEVATAHRRRAKAISGTIWRGGRVHAVTVEFPYDVSGLEEPRDSSVRAPGTPTQSDQRAE